MTLHVPKNCPRCSASFECKSGNVSNCQCAQVSVSQDTRDFLAKTDYDCLCKKCLTEINNIVHIASHSPLLRPDELIQGLHYYYDHGAVVFTEYYHILRGYCCKSGCRHCAYGCKNQTDKSPL